MTGEVIPFPIFTTCPSCGNGTRGCFNGPTCKLDGDHNPWHDSEEPDEDDQRATPTR